jgi:hypothetical protein
LAHCVPWVSPVFTFNHEIVIFLLLVSLRLDFCKELGRKSNSLQFNNNGLSFTC